MNPEKNTCPYSYRAIRSIALDFAKDVYAANKATSFTDEASGDKARFRLQVYTGGTIASERLFDISYTEGDEIIHIGSPVAIYPFEDGYISLRDSSIPELLRLLIKTERAT